MYDSLDEVLARINTLVCEHGAYQVQLNFLHDHVTLRFIDNPFRSRLNGVREIVYGTHTYPLQEYPQQACLDQDMVSILLGQFAVLSVAKHMPRLTVAAFDILNGQVECTFADGYCNRQLADEWLNTYSDFYPTTSVGRYGT